ncbi:MAG: hypothetical protein ACREL7_04385 [Longimicrobiales bacterium]
MPTRLTVSADSVASARTRIEASLFSWPVLEAIVARREAGVSEPKDEALATAIAREICSFAAPDGSWGGDVLWTAESLLLVQDLVSEPPGWTREIVDAACGWLLGRVGQPGRFGEGCDPATHDASLCDHFLPGFFAAGPPDTDLGGMTLAAGGRFAEDAAARFGISCLALQALLTWKIRDGAIDTHLVGLRGVMHRHSPVSGSRIGVAAYALGVAALAEAVHSEPDRIATLAGLTRLSALQRGDGSWPGVDLFLVLQVLLRATRLGHHIDAVDGAIVRSVGILSLMAGEDGSWGRGTGPERTLIGFRAFRRSAEIA